MELNQLFSLPLHANPCRLDPCINQNFFALPLVAKSSLGVWKISDLKQAIQGKTKPHPIELEGHSKRINALVFANGSTFQLASSCCEKILLWDWDFQTSEIKSRLFFSNPGELNVMGFDNSGKIIAAGKGPNILIIESGQNKVTSVFEMHNAMVTGVKFCPHYTATLVSISDDRTCCVWDIKDSLLLYQSSVLSSAPLLSMTMSLVSPSVALGSGDGKLIVFDLTSGHDFRQLANLDIASTINKENQKMMKKNKTNLKYTSSEECGIFAEASESILSIEYAYFGQSSETIEAIFGQNISGVGEILKDIPPYLNIITTNYLIQINSRTLDIQNMINLQASVNSEGFISSIIVGSLSYAAAKQINPVQMFVVAGTVFDQKIHIFEWYVISDNLKSVSQDNECNDNNRHVNADNELSIVATNALEINSPLKSEMLPPVVKSATTKGDIATGKKKSSSAMNQPLTFKSTVKSSGYTQAPRTTMFKPETSKQKLLNLNGPVKKTSTTKTKAGKLLKSDGDSTTNWHVKDYIDTFEVDNRTSAVLDLRFTDDGTALACALSNKTAMLVKSPFSKHICTSLIGHDHSINSVYWSNSGSHILTASNDKTVRLWDRSGGDPFMVMAYKKGTPKETPQERSSKDSTLKSQKQTMQSLSASSSVLSIDNKAFSKEIVRAQFYFMDKFILVTHGSDLSLFKYHVSPELDDLKRYQSRNRYKLVENWTTSSSSFTCSSAVNNFFSHLVLCTTSGKSIEVYDVNKSSLCHTFTECHSRPPHCIVINEGSCFSSQSSQAYNVIATMAPTDPIKLWDLRSKFCVQALVGHHNKAHACQISFSPCGNYLASGSEDRTVYVFDLRTGTFCEKLKGPRDIVCSVAFNPAKSLLAAGCLDSKIIWYK